MRTYLAWVRTLKVLTRTNVHPRIHRSDASVLYRTTRIRTSTHPLGLWHTHSGTAQYIHTCINTDKRMCMQGMSRVFNQVPLMLQSMMGPGAQKNRG